MRTFTILRDGEPVPLPYGPFTDDSGNQHSVQVLDLWNEADLAGIGVLATDVPDPLPPEVPMYKIKKLLAKKRLEGGPDLHAAIIAHFEALSEPARTLALIDFGPTETTIGSPNFVVNSPLVQSARTALGIGDESFAELIRAANALA